MIMWNKFWIAAMASLFLVMMPQDGRALDQITWSDLMIPVGPLDDPYEGLEYEQADNLDSLMRLDYRRDGKEPLPEDLEDKYDDIYAKMVSAGLDPKDLIAKYKAYNDRIEVVNSTMRKDRDGTEIRIPGYMLPLEFDGDQISEFLLVPNIGACIHTPPPPANQIIYVKPNTSFARMGMYTPVWVSGKLTIDQTQQSVGLSDGTGGFNVGYKLQAVKIEKYTQ